MLAPSNNTQQASATADKAPVKEAPMPFREWLGGKLKAEVDRSALRGVKEFERSLDGQGCNLTK